MAEPWRIYLDGLQLERGPVAARAWARDETVRRRAHEAYRATADALTGAGWDAEDALALTRAFGQDVSAWLERGETELEDLRRRLEQRWSDWQTNRGPSVQRS